MIIGPSCEILEGFLPDQDRQALLDYALAHEQQFAPSLVRRQGSGEVDTSKRLSWLCQGGLGPLTEPFRTAILEATPQVLARLGLPAFPIAEVEIELAAHRDGSFFHSHLDTMVEVNRLGLGSDRIVSFVYYFHSVPRGFSGGELALHPLGQGSSELIEPADNRLVAFPSFMPHEVLPMACPGNRFADARFAVNCWLHRERKPADPAAG